MRIREKCWIVRSVIYDMLWRGNNGELHVKSLDYGLGNGGELSL
jgi:hypothetical protein